MCRAMRSQNPLTSLVVSHRAKHLNFTVQPKELAVTDTDSKVASVADLTITSVTGGLAKRLINYTIIQVPALCAGLVPGTSIMCRSWSRYQHLDSGTSIMCRSWFRYQHYVQVLIQVPALCAGLDSGTSIMCRSWFRYQYYVQVLIQVPVLCAGLDSGTSIMCRSWFRYQYYVQVLIQVPALCAGLDSGTSIMCSSEVPTHISITKSKYVLYWKRFTPNFRPWGLCQGLPFLRSCKEKTVIPNGLNLHFSLHFYTSAKRKQYILWKQYIHSRLEAWMKSHKSGVAIT